MSKNINLEEAVQLYHEVLGLRIAEMGKDWARFDTGAVSLFITEGKSLGSITEFIVADREKARIDLMEKGCTVVKWEDKGKPCYMRDPFGFVFNLWEA